MFAYPAPDAPLHVDLGTLQPNLDLKDGAGFRWRHERPIGPDHHEVGGIADDEPAFALARLCRNNAWRERYHAYEVFAEPWACWSLVIWGFARSVGNR